MAPINCKPNIKLEEIRVLGFNKYVYEIMTNSKDCVSINLEDEKLTKVSWNSILVRNGSIRHQNTMSVSITAPAHV